MQKMNGNIMLLGLAALLSILLDAVVIVGWAASVMWALLAIWLGLRLLLKRETRWVAFLIALLVPVVVHVTDGAIQKRVDNDMAGIAKAPGLRNAKRFQDIPAIEEMTTWATRKRVLWLKQNSTGPLVEVRSFPYMISRYDLLSGTKTEHPFD
jgi:hypothetical protein